LPALKAKVWQTIPAGFPPAKHMLFLPTHLFYLCIMDVLTPEQRRKNMRAIKSRNTKIEELLAKGLWKKGFRYRRNNKTVFGKPDFTFKSLKIAIFCDSEYFHGKDWETQKHRIKTNTEFWHKKIESNIRRDKEVNEKLTINGWKVIRFWGEEIKKNLDICIDKIEEEIKVRKKEIENDKIFRNKGVNRNRTVKGC